MRVRSSVYALVIKVLLASSAIAEPLRVVVQLAGDNDDALLERIRGQTVDLDLSLIPIHGDAPSPRVSAQFVAATALAQRHDARVVIWFRPPDPDGIVVYVAEPARDAVFVRRIPQRSSDPSARSATIEAAALAVRSALRALASGERIGVTSAQAARDQATRKPARVRGAASRRPPDTPRPSGTVGWRAGVGWHAVADGASAVARHAVSGRFELARRGWHVALEASTGPAVTVEDEWTALRVGRHRAAVAVGASPWRHGRAVVVVDVTAGAVVSTRSTEVRSPQVTATPRSRTIALALGTGIRYRRPLGRRGLFLELYAAGELALGMPEFGYEIGGRFESRAALWPIQPRVGAGLVYRGL